MSHSITTLCANCLCIFAWRFFFLLFVFFFLVVHLEAHYYFIYIECSKFSRVDLWSLYYSYSKVVCQYFTWIERRKKIENSRPRLKRKFFFHIEELKLFCGLSWGSTYNTPIFSLYSINSIISMNLVQFIFMSFISHGLRGLMQLHMYMFTHTHTYYTHFVLV